MQIGLVFFIYVTDQVLYVLKGLLRNKYIFSIGEYNIRKFEQKARVKTG